MGKTVNAMGKPCPMPVVLAKKALEECKQGERLEVLVDNEIAAANLSKLAASQGCGYVCAQKGEKEFSVVLIKGEEQELQEAPSYEACCPSPKSGLVVAVSSDRMGEGDEALGRILLKGFLYALTQAEERPGTVLFYNGGARLTVEGAETLEDIKELERQGVEILTCGTCLNHYGLTEKLAVGEVTNMYTIVETLTKAGKVIRP